MSLHFSGHRFARPFKMHGAGSDVVGELDGEPVTRDEHDRLVLESHTDRWRHGTVKYPDGSEWWMGGGSGGVFWRRV